MTVPTYCCNDMPYHHYLVSHDFGEVCGCVSKFILYEILVILN